MNEKSFPQIITKNEQNSFLSLILANIHPAIYSVVCFAKINKILHKIIAVLDTGSSSTIIDAGFARHHNLHKVSGPFTKHVSYIDRLASYEAYEVEITLVGQDTKVTQTLTAHTVENFSKSCLLQDWNELARSYKHLNTVNTLKPPYPPLGTILLGCDNAHLFEIFESRKGSVKEPIANRTPLGWAFMGPRNNEDTNISQTLLQNCHSTFKSSDDFLAEVVTREFDLEHFGLQENEQKFSKGFSGGPKDPASWSPSEKRSDDKMSIRHKKPNIFEVSIPWCDDYKSNLVNNFFAVRNRQERSHTPQYLAKKDVLISEVDTIIDGYVEKGYIEPVPVAEQGQGWYLPFFEVVNRHKSTPIRLVFDAKAAYNKVSLNSQIEDTPNRLNDLVLTLLNLRRYPFAITGDISEMFLRIRLDPNDKRYHRFYHNGKHYQWTRILFGNKCSPNASQKVLSHLCDIF